METNNCRVCNQTKPIAEFVKRKGAKLGVGNLCKACYRAERQIWRNEHKEYIKEKGKEFKIKNRTKINEYIKKYYVEHREEKIAKAKIYYDKTKQAHLDKGKRYRQKLRLEVLSHYSYSPEPICKRCGFTDMRTLTIDHINGGGLKHIKSLFGKSGGMKFYKWLRDNNYPDGYQVLCMNCQWIKKEENKEYYKK